jgi:F-type H+-transporting ATPase subunit f
MKQDAQFFFSFRLQFQSGGSGAGLQPLVDFYSKLPKGNAVAGVGGVKGRYFSGANASGKPLAALIFGIWAISYTIDYNSAFFFSFQLGLVLTPLTLCSISFLFTLIVHLSTSFHSL